jgi:Xaa-Pro aminopeptidase
MTTVQDTITADASREGRRQPPFDHRKLDALLDQHGIDVLLVSSRHNLRYLLGGYSFFFFEGFEAFGTSRYFPLMVYFRGKPEQTVYVGNAMEAFERDLGKFWMSSVRTSSWGLRDALEVAASAIPDAAGQGLRLGIEPDFLPTSAAALLSRSLPSTRLVDASRALELLRAIKTPRELALVQSASNEVVASILAVIAAKGAGSTKREWVDALAREERARGLRFEYCLIAAGKSFNRSPSDDILREGDIVSVDSGGNLDGYIGDLCRMAIVGEPTEEHEDVLAEIDAIQIAARSAIREGALGRDIYARAGALIERSRFRDRIDFVAHGLGSVTHETPRLAPSGFPYGPDDADLPLQEGMVLSVETAIKHPRLGFVKLEDTIALTPNGPEAYGDFGRGWNRCLG